MNDLPARGGDWLFGDMLLADVELFCEPPVETLEELTRVEPDVEQARPFHLIGSQLTELEKHFVVEDVDVVELDEFFS